MPSRLTVLWVGEGTNKAIYGHQLLHLRDLQRT